MPRILFVCFFVLTLVTVSFAGDMKNGCQLTQFGKAVNVVEINFKAATRLRTVTLQAVHHRVRKVKPEAPKQVVVAIVNSTKAGIVVQEIANTSVVDVGDDNSADAINAPVRSITISLTPAEALLRTGTSDKFVKTHEVFTNNTQPYLFLRDETITDVVCKFSFEEENLKSKELYRAELEQLALLPDSNLTRMVFESARQYKGEAFGAETISNALPAATAGISANLLTNRSAPENAHLHSKSLVLVEISPGKVVSIPFEQLIAAVKHDHNKHLRSKPKRKLGWRILIAAVRFIAATTTVGLIDHYAEMAINMIGNENWQMPAAGASEILAHKVAEWITGNKHER